ncbi:MAG: RNA polymerase sigma factor [Planctomycetota bacterium]|jgi:RNA polymerase sigma-70 factor (ECF subfamily)
MYDLVLVNRCKNGDRDALRRIYEKYRDDLLILATALCGDINVAEDAVHDTFVKFAGSVGDFKVTGSLRAYLAACAANRVRDLMRANRRRSHRAEPQDFDSADPSQIIACNEQLRQLSFALGKLPEEQREAVVLRTFGRMRFTVIAASLGVSVNTVKGRYRYGIGKLRSLLNGELEK